MTGLTLVAGIGNIFLGDDGFGVEVAARLAAAPGLPDGVRVADYGISGMHLAYDLAEGYETIILVDALPRGGEPGTVYLMEADTGSGHKRGSPESLLLDAHGMQPDVVLGLLDVLGADIGRVLVVGCEPASTQEGIGLSDPVAAAVGQAVDLVQNLVRDTAAGRQPAERGTHPGKG